MKCDFCGKPCKYYGSYHCVFYCDEHVKEAEEVERKMWEGHDEMLRNSSDSSEG